MAADLFLRSSLPGLTWQSFIRKRFCPTDARAKAAPKGLRPRRRVKPAHDVYHFGISPKVLPIGNTAWRIRRESSTAAWRCFTASR